MTNEVNPSDKLVGSSSLQAGVMENIKNTQHEYEKISESNASQQNYTDFPQMAKANTHNEYNNLNHEFNLKENLLQNNTLVDSKLTSAENSLKDLITTARDAQTLISKKNSPSGENMNFEADVDNLLTKVESALNFKDSSGKYLFGGTKTNEAPVKDLKNFSNLNDEGMPTNNYFNGNTKTPEYQIDENRFIRLGVSAGDESFKDLIGGLNLLKEGKIEEGENYITQAEQGLVGARSSIGTSRANIAQQNERLEDNKIFMKDQYNELFSANTAEIAAQAKQVEAQLQLSMKIFSMVQGTRLADFV
jgi:flagellin-like hook-associated protein FlgL